MRKILALVAISVCMTLGVLSNTEVQIVNAESAKTNVHLKQKILDLYKVKNAGVKNVDIDSQTLDEIRKFVLQGNDILTRDSETLWNAFMAAHIVRTQIKKKYKWGEGLSDKDMDVLKKTSLIRDLFLHDGALICAENNNEKKVELLDTIRNIRSESGEKYRKNKKYKNSTEHIRALEGIYSLCKYSGAKSLLRVYHRKTNHNEKFRHKFNRVMLDLIREDQEIYDYNPGGMRNKKSFFAVHLADFISYINHPSKELLLSKNDVELIAESMLTKYRAGLKELDASAEYGIGNYFMFIDMTRLLCHYEIYDMAGAMVEDFLTDEGEPQRLMQTVMDPTLHPAYRKMPQCLEIIKGMK